jgi:hypothetical protein
MLTRCMISPISFNLATGTIANDMSNMTFQIRLVGNPSLVP